MNQFQFLERGPLLAFSMFAALVVVACGGGGQESPATDGRVVPLAAGLGAAIVWTPALITDTANPGSRQDIPVTFTAAADVSNVALSVVPALKGSVTVTPSSFASLQKGQVVRVTLSIAPPANAALGTTQGTVQVRLGSSTIASPLPVNVVVIAPEVISGITVPPEPPADLNNATLAGFDANGNGVRDDVERLIAKHFGGTADYPLAFAYAKQYQIRLTSPPPRARADALTEVSMELCQVKNASDALLGFSMDDVMANSSTRKQTLRAFNDILVAYISRELPSCVN